MAPIQIPDDAIETEHAASGWLMPSLMRWVAVALLVRLAAALALDFWARRRGVVCLFDDTRIYWYLAGRIRDGLPYMVPQYEQPHFALRTPGYPLFLAACRWLFGDFTLVPRLIQVISSALGVGALMLLVGRLLGYQGRGRNAVEWTGRLAALEPFSVGLSVLLLSEALFVPLMILGLYGLERLARPVFDSQAKLWRVGLGTGLVQGATVLVRPSWLLFVPLACFWLLIDARNGAVVNARLRSIALLMVGFVLIMSPWWVRNAQVFHRFVPTALWMGASLYDGLNPQATGASDMRFLDDPQIRSLDEQSQDRFLNEQAWAFVRDRPVRALELAAIKFGRFWSPWPNAAEFRNPAIAVLSALVTVPLFAMMAVGLVSLRGNGRALFLLAAPLVYVALLHLVFVGSIRYRLAAQVPAFGLAAWALSTMRSPQR